MRILTAALLTGLACLLLSGCGDKGLPSKVVHGTVTFEGKPVDLGSVRFVPIEGTSGPASVGQIMDGNYHIKARGGVVLGKHRVEVKGLNKTGRQVRGHNGLEEAMIDETLSVGPPAYAGPKSPLVYELRADSGKYSPKGWDCNASNPLNAGKNDDSNWMLHPFGEYLLIPVAASTSN